eukprot:7277513-Prymnesium_polylepis.1
MVFSNTQSARDQSWYRDEIDRRHPLLQIANAVGAVWSRACWLRLTSALQSLVRAVFVRATPSERSDR